MTSLRGTGSRVSRNYRFRVVENLLESSSESVEAKVWRGSWRSWSAPGPNMTGAMMGMSCWTLRNLMDELAEVWQDEE